MSEFLEFLVKVELWKENKVAAAWTCVMVGIYAVLPAPGYSVSRLSSFSPLLLVTFFGNSLLVIEILQANVKDFMLIKLILFSFMGLKNEYPEWNNDFMQMIYSVYLLAIFEIAWILRKSTPVIISNDHLHNCQLACPFNFPLLN